MSTDLLHGLIGFTVSLALSIPVCYAIIMHILRRRIADDKPRATYRYLDPQPDVTADEYRAIIAVYRADPWMIAEIPEGLERHFAAMDDGMAQGQSATQEIAP